MQTGDSLPCCCHCVLSLLNRNSDLRVGIGLMSEFLKIYEFGCKLPKPDWKARPSEEALLLSRKRIPPQFLAAIASFSVFQRAVEKYPRLPVGLGYKFRLAQQF